MQADWRVRRSMSAFEVGEVQVQRMRHGRGLRLSLSKHCRRCRHGRNDAIPLRGLIMRELFARALGHSAVGVQILFAHLPAHTHSSTIAARASDPMGHLTGVGAAGEATRTPPSPSHCPLWECLGTRCRLLSRLRPTDQKGVERSPLQERSADDEPSWLSHELLPILACKEAAVGLRGGTA